jgi:hypothetical protein
VLQNYFTDEVFLNRLAKSPEEDLKAEAISRQERFSDQTVVLLLDDVSGKVCAAPLEDLITNACVVNRCSRLGFAKSVVLTSSTPSTPAPPRESPGGQ